jgi:hypothetical protein
MRVAVGSLGFNFLKLYRCQRHFSIIQAGTVDEHNLMLRGTCFNRHKFAQILSPHRGNVFLTRAYRALLIA